MKRFANSGSISVVLIVGGTVFSCNAIKQAIPSIAPAAPNKCPVIDFVAETANELLAPKTRLAAINSLLSPNEVEVACIFI